MDDEEQQQKKRRKIWVHDILKKRKTEGEFFTLHKDLVDDETNFFQYFRITKHTFQYILNKISTDFKKQNTTFQALSPLENLTVCLK